MLEKGNEIFLKVGNIIIDKLKELKDPAEIGKCARTIIRAVGIGYVINVICQNGGINYDDKLLIGVRKNND